MNPEHEEAAVEGGARVRRSLSIDAAAEALLRTWRDPRVQAQVVAPLAVLVSGDEASCRWRVDLPLNRTAELESRELAVDAVSARHAVRSVAGPDVAAELEFSTRPAPADFGTEATLAVRYALPGGMLADAVAKWLGAAPEALAAKVLRRLKALVETGEIPTLEANPSARDDDKTAEA